MEAVTVAELYNILAKEVKAGNGSKKILLSSDDEGNSYHEMFYHLTPVEKAVYEEYQLPYDVSMEKAKSEYVVLG